MPPKSALPYTGLPEGEDAYYNNKQHHYGKENNERMSTMVMLRNGTVEYWIRLSNQSPICKAHKSKGLRRRFLLMVRADSVGKAENIANVELKKKSLSGREKIIWDSLRGNQRWCYWPEGKKITKLIAEYLNIK